MESGSTLLGSGETVALLTDLYELTMAYGYWTHGMFDRPAVFHVTFRTLPFHGGYAIAAGLDDVIDFLSRLRFADDDVAYLRSLRGDDGGALFEPRFLEALRTGTFTCDIDAVPEGTVVFPHEPLLRVRGPLGQAQIIETALLNILNFQTLVATKAARVCLAAAGDPVIEFGLRRAQGINGGLAASRAAYLGGCAATSNVLAGKRFAIPVKGTHAHSWVMAFADELTAFEAYADAMPNNCVLLVDTYDTLAGVRNAIRVGRRLRARGFDLAGIRLDSGDLAYLSAEARRMLDEAGFNRTAILASNDLDEHVISSLKQQGATITVWGVGTKLVTANDQPALGGVYKLAAIRNEAGTEWEYKLKLSEQPAKLSIPGMLNVRRFTESGRFVGDMIVDEIKLPQASSPRVLVDPGHELRRKTISAQATSEELLVPIFREGRCVYPRPSLDDSRARTLAQLRQLHPASLRLLNPHEYPAGLELGLHERRMALAQQARSLRSVTG